VAHAGRNLGLSSEAREPMRIESGGDLECEAFTDAIEVTIFDAPRDRPSQLATGAQR
jgi:hypothetical protein